MAGDLGLSSAGRQEGGEHPQGRGLARPVGAEKAEDLAAFDGQVDPADGVHGPGLELERPGQAAGADDG
jgi:hypothetical protein